MDRSNRKLPELRRMLGRVALLALVAIMYTMLGGSRLSAAPLATTNDFKQCANNETSGPVTGLGNCHWINSILQHTNSVYTEGMSVPQRTIIGTADSPIPSAATHSFTFSHQATKGGDPLHAYDFIVSWDQAKADAAAVGITLNLNRCGVEGGATSLAACNTIVTAGFYKDVIVPDDTFVSVDGPTSVKIGAYEAMRGDRTIRIWGDQAINSASLSAPLHRCGNQANSTPCSGSDDNQDTNIFYTLTWDSASTMVLIEVAGHLAITCPDPFTGPTTCASNNVAWTNPKGSANINGGPYHFHYEDFDGSGGRQDNQIQGASIIPSPAVSTQCYVDGVPCAGQNVPVSSASFVVSDTVTLTGTTAAVTGNAKFWLCKNPALAFPATDCSTNPTVTSTVVYASDPISVTGGVVAKASTPPQTITTAGAAGGYCWVVSFFTDAPLNYNNTHLFDNVAGSRECFTISTPTAVTLSSFEAGSQQSLVNEATIGFGLAGIFALAAVAVVVLRRK